VTLANLHPRTRERYLARYGATDPQSAVA